MNVDGHSDVFDTDSVESKILSPAGGKSNSRYVVNCLECLQQTDPNNC